MPLQNFVDGKTPLIGATWLNKVDVLLTTVFNQATSVAAALNALGATAVGTLVFQAASAAAARTVILAAASGVNTDITSLSAPALGAATATTASPGDSSIKVATTAFVGAAITAQASVPLRSYLAGLGLSTAGGSATMSIAVGQAANSDNTLLMTLAGALGKTTSAWAVGTGNGGLDTGAIANTTWYHWYLIERPDTAVVDVIFSLSASAPTLPTNYTKYRRIGSGLTNVSAQWIAFTQVGDSFEWTTPVIETTSATPGTSAISQTFVNVPTGVIVSAIFNAATNTSGMVYFSPLTTTDAAPSATISPLTTMAINGSTISTTGRITVRTNASAQLRYRCSSNTQVFIATIGYIDRRGQDA